VLTFYEKMNDFLLENSPFVAVTVVDTIGSVPVQVGSKMIVTSEGLSYGTVGGGKVETRAISEAKKLLANDSTLVQHSGGDNNSTYFVNWALDRDIGMTCGGSVKMYFEAFNTNPWRITIFGAGHVANALINLLIKLDCRITCFDPRQEWLNKLPLSTKVTKLMASDMPAKVDTISADSFVVLVTMGHTTDKPILIKLLKQYKEKKFPYIGVIGSAAKAARLYKDIAEAGLPASSKELFHCPMGLPIGNNHPQEIAISIAAQLLQERDKLRKPTAALADSVS
jgi:xanthine dehydrogenase accessory factor